MDAFVSQPVPEIFVDGKDKGFTASKEQIAASPSDWGAFNAAITASAQAPAMVPEIAPTPAPIETPPVETLTTDEMGKALGFTPTQPDQPQAVDKVEVPKKFLGPDGQVAIEKLVKSYKELEKGMSRKNAPQVPNAQPMPGVQPSPIALDPFQAQVENDIRTRGLVPVITDLFQAAQEAAYARATHENSEIRESFQSQKMRAELESIQSVDPAVFSEAGIAKLQKVLTDHPYMMQSPTPWTDAYAKLKLNELMYRPAPPVVTPRPQGMTMPQASVSPTRQDVPKPQRIETKDQLEAALKTLNPAQQQEFLARQIGWRL